MIDKENITKYVQSVRQNQIKALTNVNVSLSKRPPMIPKKERKKVNFPSDVEWRQSPSKPNIFFLPLLDITRSMMESYVQWWSEKYNGKLIVDSDKEEYEIELEDVIIHIKHDDKFWYCIIRQKMKGGE